jgi:hypothetical protein
MSRLLFLRLRHFLPIDDGDEHLRERELVLELTC